jgi:hypothetical protein
MWKNMSVTTENAVINIVIECRFSYTIQQSGNQGADLYVATVDGIVRELMQVVRYYQYLKGEHAGTGPRREKLLLCVAQCSVELTTDSKILHIAMTKLLQRTNSVLLSHT